MKTLGLIAGNGNFPLLVARQARAQGYRVAICALEKEAKPELKECSDFFTWVKIGELKKLTQFFKTSQVHEAVMAGKVEKVRLFQENVRPDFEMVKVLMKTRDFKDDSLLLSITEYLNGEGIRIIDSTSLIQNELPGAGVLGNIKPSVEVMEDIRFGFRMAKAIAGLDIGQTVVIKKKAVISVEAIEGTDQAIRRGGELAQGRITVVKVAKPNQDMRFDVPAVGMTTLESLIAVKAQAFAFEARKTIFLDRELFIKEADQHKIVLFGIDPTIVSDSL